MGGGAARGGPNYAHQRSGHKEKAKEAFIIGVKRPKTGMLKAAGRLQAAAAEASSGSESGNERIADPKRGRRKPDMNINSKMCIF